MITQEYLHERFTYLDGELYWRVVFSNRLKIGQLAGDKDGAGYRRIMLGKKHHKMHRLIWIMFNGDIPEAACVDHIDCDRSNNSIDNLRLVTKSGNNRNRANKPTGVTFDAIRQKWRAQSSVDDVTVFLGRFDKREDAEAAYKSFVELQYANGEVISETS